MNSQFVKLDLEDGISRIKFDRPEELNAVNPDVLYELESALIYCEGDEQIRVVFVTGNENAFVPAADVGNMAQSGVKG